MSGKLGALPPIPARPQLRLAPFLAAVPPPSATVDWRRTQAALYAAAGLLVTELPVIHDQELIEAMADDATNYFDQSLPSADIARRLLDAGWRKQ